MADTTFVNFQTPILAEWLNDVNDLTYNISGTGSGQGAHNVGYKRSESGAIDETVASNLDKQIPSIMSIIPTALHAEIYAKTSTADVSSYFQAMVNLGKPFTVPAGALFRFGSPLNWVTGARMIGGSANYPGTTTPNTSGETLLLFNADVMSYGIQIQAPTGGTLQNWEIKGCTLGTYGSTANRFALKMLYMPASAGSGVCHFNLEDITIQSAGYGIYADDGFFSGTFKRVLITTCVYGLYRSANEASTSLSGSIWFFHVFAPMKLWNTVYSTLEVFCDHCGKNASTLAQAPATEMPILLYANATQALTFPYFGIEASNAMVQLATNNAVVSANVSMFFSVADIFTPDNTRTANVAFAEQALFHQDNSTTSVSGLRVFATVVAGYPVFNAGNPRYFAYFKNAEIWTKLHLENCQLDVPSFGVHPAGQTGFVATRMTNGALVFGNTAAVPFNPYLTYTNGVLTAGIAASGASTAHSITGPVTYAEGVLGFFVRGSPGAAASGAFYAVNGASANAANAAFKVSVATSNSRSINCAGTVNASGADYAEYERNNGLSIAKGQIVGFKADGTLTLTYSESVRFGVKSTDPAYVGGDSWCTAVEPEDGAPPEASEAFKAQIEVDRAKVDRIAYSGKVPCNVGGAVPGQYIVAAPGPDDSIIGLPVTSPSFEQYRAAVGRVNRVLDDGRAEIAVIIH